jgi:1-aminocyclopropane-1-carboxylate deaminase/D-cysteine desulfhydrase-like pyridoxal-dependent ACC family enzyme
LSQAGTGAPIDIVTALGSGGLAAGLLFALDDDDVRHDVVVHAVPVAKTAAQARQAIRNLLDAVQPDPARTLVALARLRIISPGGPDDGYAGRIASSCGVLLDPVFTGPAWRAYGARARDPGRATVLLASGGLPAVFDSVTEPEHARREEGMSPT